MDGHLPHDVWKIQELWHLEVKLLEIVIQGLAIIDARINYLHHNNNWNLLKGYLPPVSVSVDEPFMDGEDDIEVSDEHSAEENHNGDNECHSDQ